jgi:hypothetical protein
VPGSGKLIGRAWFLLNNDLWYLRCSAPAWRQSQFLFHVSTAAAKAERRYSCERAPAKKKITYRLPEFGDRFPSPDEVRRIWGSLMLKVGGLLLLGFEVLAVGVPDPEVVPEGAMVV